MYASILRGDRERASGSAAIDTLWRAVTTQPGLVVAYVLANAADPRDGMVLSIWESEDAFAAYAEMTLRDDVEATGATGRTNYYVLRATI